MPSDLKGLPVPKGLDVESGLNGFALRSPRSSAQAGAPPRRKKRRSHMESKPQLNHYRYKQETHCPLVYGIIIRVVAMVLPAT